MYRKIDFKFLLHSYSIEIVIDHSYRLIIDNVVKLTSAKPTGFGTLILNETTNIIKSHILPT